MILADTSIWVDHLRRTSRDLSRFLEDRLIICHPFVVGELACGNIRNRDEILSLLTALPTATVAEHDEATQFVTEHELQRKGLGWIDIHLLAAARLSGCSLWTRDRKLASAASALKVGL